MVLNTEKRWWHKKKKMVAQANPEKRRPGELWVLGVSMWRGMYRYDKPWGKSEACQMLVSLPG